MAALTETLRILYVEDNRQVADAVAAHFKGDARFTWLGYLTTAEELVAQVASQAPDVVIVDLDLPGSDAFGAMAALRNQRLETRVLVFSGRVTPTSIDQALEAGAWGYVYKSDGMEALLAGVLDVSRGDFSLSSTARKVYSQA